MHRTAFRRATRWVRRSLSGAQTLWRIFALTIVATSVPSVSGAAEESVPTIRGLPFTRSYPLEEIGDVPRGARLSFDRFGRVAVVHDNIYSVLNDTTWLDLAEKSEGSPTMAFIAHGSDGHAYFGGLGSWGTIELTASGKLRPHPLVPATVPRWVTTTSFNDIIVTQRGVYFAGSNGVVFWDFATQENELFAIPSIQRIFSIGENVYSSSYGDALRFIDVENHTVRSVPGANFGGVPVDQATSLDETHALLSTRDGRLMVFDGTTATPWAAQARNDLTGRISGLRHLLDGGTAVAITGRGLFLISEKGELFTTLTSSDYHRITAMETREAGVLWTIGEDGVKKIHYGSPLSVFGQRLGLTLSWPIVVGWNGKVIVASGGRLFEAIPGGPGSASRFELNKNSPVDGSWTIAASGSQLLVGNNRGLHIMTPDGSLTRIGADMDIARIVPLENGLCFAIGRTEIAVFRSTNGQWAECAPRIASPGHPSVVHAARESVWIELGMTRVVRVSLRDGKIQSRVFEDFPWKDAHWVNVGIIDDTIILSGPPGKRLFFDETTETFTQAAVLQRLLERSPQWILRVRKDAAGTIWATHEQGVVTFEPHDGEYLMDATTFELNNEHFPLVQFLPGNDVWVSTGQSLYHVEEHHAHAPPSTLQPILVSIMDGKTNAELFQQESVSAPAPALRLPYAQNNLSFRFFAGSYTWRRTPIYEFRLNGGPDRWTNLGTGSLISFSGLREGTYQLEVRIANSRGSAGLPTTTNFQVLPPWHRTLPAYLLYGLGAGLAVFGLLRWSIHHTRHRNIALENLVRERTEQLTAAMEKLNEEARNAATLAERDRLAGEIHDSLQQGLSGLILQLDATLKLPTLTADVRTRLNVARNMVSFTRHEVQHAVWDMESPLLEDTELGEALRKLTSLINSGAGRIEIDVTGTPQTLPSATKHHLLRIAQEAITNAVRHASATNITVRLDYQPEAVCLTISDDGVGFQPDDVLEKSIGHFGLRGLRGRAKKIGGILAIKSLLGEGTLIEIKVPLSAYLNSPRDVVTAPSVV